MGKLYVICGESGVGKTLIAKRLAAETGMVYIEADTITERLDSALFAISPAIYPTFGAAVTNKLVDAREDILLRVCADNLRVGNSVILVTQRYTKHEEWEEAVKKSGVNLSGELVDFYVISRGEAKRKETNNAYHYINSSNINLDDVKSLIGV